MRSGRTPRVDDDRAVSVRAAWMASTKSPSWFDCMCSTVKPASLATSTNVADVVVERGGAVHLGLALRRAGSGSVRSAAARQPSRFDPRKRLLDGVDARRRSPVSRPFGPSSTNVMPSTAFLSRPNSADQLAGVGVRRHRASAGRTNATTRRCSATRSSSMRPSARASSAANTSPMPTASPWRRS